MTTNKNESLLFANEDAIYRIISVARIVSWVVLGIYLISFSTETVSMFQSGVQWPTQVSQILLMIANLVFAPAIGLFYFLVLQGVAQGLNLGLDIFYELRGEEDDDIVEDEN